MTSRVIASFAVEEEQSQHRALARAAERQLIARRRALRAARGCGSPCAAPRLNLHPFTRRLPRDGRRWAARAGAVTGVSRCSGSHEVPEEGHHVPQALQVEASDSRTCLRDRARAGRARRGRVALHVHRQRAGRPVEHQRSYEHTAARTCATTRSALRSRRARRSGRERSAAEATITPLQADGMRWTAMAQSYAQQQPTAAMSERSNGAPGPEPALGPAGRPVHVERVRLDRRRRRRLGRVRGCTDCWASGSAHATPPGHRTGKRVSRTR